MKADGCKNQNPTRNKDYYNNNKKNSKCVIEKWYKYHHCYCHHINKSCHVLLSIFLYDTIKWCSPTRPNKFDRFDENSMEKKKKWFPNDDRINELFRTFYVLCWIYFSAFPGFGTLCVCGSEWEKIVLNAYNAMKHILLSIMFLNRWTFEPVVPKNELSILHWVWIPK